jgi:hypothetical protein
MCLWDEKKSPILSPIYMCVVLSGLVAGGLQHRALMYVDDVVTFLRPTKLNMPTCLAIVEEFCVASGLHCRRIVPSVPSTVSVVGS